jgi:hypothetical protein
MHGREQCRHGTTLRDADHVSSFGTGGVHDRTEVTDILLESGSVRYRVG